MKKTSILILIIGLPFINLATRIERSSSGAPAAHTGAPNEATCAVSGCHDDNKVNAGTAQLSIEVGNNLQQYTPGETYPIKIKIADSQVQRFGFQIVALYAQDAENAGTLSITDALRTQIVTDLSGVINRKYATYTFRGTDAVSTGNGEWAVNWTAPLAAKGSVTFYVGAVSTNDDMGDKGDYVYTKSITISN
jgi:hypothetical protein